MIPKSVVNVQVVRFAESSKSRVAIIQMSTSLYSVSEYVAMMSVRNRNVCIKPYHTLAARRGTLNSAVQQLQCVKEFLIGVRGCTWQVRTYQVQLAVLDPDAD